LQLQPGLAAARLELATVWLALAEPDPALALLTALVHTPSVLLCARRAQANVLGTSVLVAAALSLNSRLPEALPFE